MTDTPWKTDDWHTSPWNFAPEVTAEWNFPAKIQIHDVTLRDGEQQAGLAFNYEDKIRIAEGLAEASEAGGLEDLGDPDVSLYRRRLRDSHDLFHDVAGYGRDALGELCVLSFGTAQFYNHGIAFILGVGIPKMKLEAAQLPVARAAFEAWRRGRAGASGSGSVFHWRVCFGAAERGEIGGAHGGARPFNISQY